MKMLLLTIISALLFTSCEKEDLKPGQPEPVHPQMMYKDLGNAEAKFMQPVMLDVDDDGSVDFSFSVLHVGDAVLQRDRLQFLAKSKADRNLLNDANDQSPMLARADLVRANPSGYTWWELSSVLLTEKITTYDDISWAGTWKKADRNYLPIQVKKNGKIYHGWIELSFDQIQEKIILHKAAVSREEERDIKAGY